MSQCPLCQCCEVHRLWQVPDSSEFTVYRCQRCRVEFLAPQPSDAFLRSLYTQSYYDAWGLQEDGGAVRDMKLSSFAFRLDLIKGHKRSGRILDVGCATGFFLEAARDAGFDPYGVEFSPYSAGIAKEKFGAQAIFQGTLEEAPFPAGSFDVVAMSDLLEHVRDPHAVLAKTRELLREDGIVMVMTPDTGSCTRRLMGRNWAHYKAEHLFYFDTESLGRLAAQQGFRLMHREPARKSLDLAYVYHQFRRYRHWLLTPACGALHRLLPERMLQAKFDISVGEMVVLLEKIR